MHQEENEMSQAMEKLSEAVAKLQNLKDEQERLEKKKKNKGFWGSLFGAVAFEAIAIKAEEYGNDDLAKKSEALADGYFDDAFDFIFAFLDVTVDNLKKSFDYFERERHILLKEKGQIYKLAEKHFDDTVTFNLE